MNYLRIKKNKEITGILKNGARGHSESLTVAYVPAERTKMAVCVGKKHGKSTERNRIKRLLREVFRLRADELSYPCACVLLPKVAQEYSFSVFRRDLGKILKRERLIEYQHPKSDQAERQVSPKNGV